MQFQGHGLSGFVVVVVVLMVAAKVIPILSVSHTSQALVSFFRDIRCRRERKQLAKKMESLPVTKGGLTPGSRCCSESASPAGSRKVSTGVDPKVGHRLAFEQTTAGMGWFQRGY